MSILSKGTQLDYLQKYRDGKIKQGLGIGVPMLDKHIAFKPKEISLIIGHDNVGKTYMVTYYALCLAVIHNIKWCIWSGENGHGQIYRDMIQMLSGTPFMELTHQQIRYYSNYLEQYFDFADNKKLYTPDDLLANFQQTNADACLIDPYTGLDRGFEWSDNYKFLNKARHFCNNTGISLYINTHPNTASGRSVYKDGHIWAGHRKMPFKDDVEGGKAYCNRVDNAICIHRLTQHPDMKYYTMISVDKIKDIDTGGEQTMMDNPILAEYNFGLGFKIGGIDALEKSRKEIKQKMNERLSPKISID